MTKNEPTNDEGTLSNVELNGIRLITVKTKKNQKSIQNTDSLSKPILEYDIPSKTIFIIFPFYTVGSKTSKIFSVNLENMDVKKVSLGKDQSNIHVLKTYSINGSVFMLDENSNNVFITNDGGKTFSTAKFKYKITKISKNEENKIMVALDINHHVFTFKISFIFLWMTEIIGNYSMIILLVLNG